MKSMMDSAVCICDTYQIESYRHRSSPCFPSSVVVPVVVSVVVVSTTTDVNALDVSCKPPDLKAAQPSRIPSARPSLARKATGPPGWLAS